MRMTTWKETVAMSRRRLLTVIDQAVMRQPLNKAFLTDLMSAIERDDMDRNRKPSRYYKPSSLVCLRQMYFQRIGEIPDKTRTEYTLIGMSDTGSRRHEAIQRILGKMESMGFDWRYLDIEDYVKRQQSVGKCNSIKVIEKVGAETKLFDSALQVSFMCDGIVQRISTGACFLFEFKNQISFKYANKEEVDPEHVDQVTCYCTCLELDRAFVLYENRDVCQLECPEIFSVTEEMKQACVGKIMECEGYVERLVPPPAHKDTKPCRWCAYQTPCGKAGK